MAHSEEHYYCRELLRLTMVEVRAIFSKEEIASAWVWEGARKSYEFHGPNREYIYGLSADCAWSARAEGWGKILRMMEEGCQNIERSVKHSS